MEEISGLNLANLAVAIVGVAVGLALLVGALWLIRGRNGPSPFIRGGKNRVPRLQVLDAAAVDTRRRLVLVRRDDVEHLVMIGGPTDIVIESGIKSASHIAAPAPAAEQRPIASRIDTRPNPERTEPDVKRPVATAPPQARQANPQPPAVVQAKPVTAVEAPPARKDVPASIDNATHQLEAARQRVFIDAPGSAPHLATGTEAPASLQPAIERPQQISSDFERILEQEMENNLAAQNTVTNLNAKPAAPQNTTGALQPADASLRLEAARIFGEPAPDKNRQ